MDEWPYPEGTYVVAKHRDGIPLRVSCAGHIWRITSNPVPVEYGCGFIQCAVCLVCGGVPSPPLDADFFWKKADGFDVAGCFGEIAETIEWLGETRAKLEAWWNNGGEADTPLMKDFG